MTEKDSPSSDLAPVPVKRDAGDVAHITAKAALSAIPILGGPAAELFNAVLAPPLARRRDEWLNALAERVASLGAIADAWKPENLAENAAFISAAMTASQAAMRTHLDEKLDALRNAVLNSAAPTAPDDHEQLMYLQFIDELTPLHLRVLKYASDPKGWFAEHQDLNAPTIGSMGSPGHILEAALPDLTRDVYDQMVFELNNRGLTTNVASLHTTMTADGAWGQWASDRGRRFVEFIQEPKP